MSCLSASLALTPQIRSFPATIYAVKTIQLTSHLVFGQFLANFRPILVENLLFFFLPCLIAHFWRNLQYQTQFHCT